MSVLEFGKKDLPFEHWRSEVYNVPGYILITSFFLIRSLISVKNEVKIGLLIAHCAVTISVMKFAYNLFFSGSEMVVPFQPFATQWFGYVVPSSTFRQCKIKLKLVAIEKWAVRFCITIESEKI